MKIVLSGLQGTKCLDDSVVYCLTQQCDEAFTKLKQSLMSQPLLKYPDYSRQFTLTTDASKDAIGAVLSQDYDGKNLLICYHSRILNKAETNYSVTERELLDIVDACQKFRPYLYGRPFQIMKIPRHVSFVDD